MPQLSMNEQLSNKPPQELLWVYKTPKSAVLSRSSQDEAASINSHAQRWQKRTRRTPKDGPREARQTSGTSRIHIPARVSGSDTSQSLSSYLKDSLPHTGPTTPSCQPDDADEPTQEISHIPRQLCLEGTAIDPFQSSIIKMDYQSTLLLQYYISTVFPPLWRRMASVRSLPKEPREFQMACRETVQQHLSSKLHIITLLAAMASRMEHLDKRSVQSGSNSFINRAIVAVREHLSKLRVISVDEIWDVWNLWRAELIRGNYFAAETHLQALKTMTDQIGGLEALDTVNSWMMESLVVGDLFMAMETLARPIFPCTWDPGKAATRGFENFYSDASLARLGFGMLLHAKCQIVNVELYAIVQDIIECIHMLFHSWNDSSMEVKALKWEYRRKLAIRHRLSCLNPGDARSESLRIALLVWSVLVLNLGSDYGLRRTVKVTAPRLRDALMKARVDFLPWNEHSGILAWILTVGAMALEGEAGQDWFIEHLGILLSYAGIRSEAEFVGVLEGSLYVHKVQHSALKKITARLETAKKWPVD